MFFFYIYLIIYIFLSMAGIQDDLDSKEPFSYIFLMGLASVFSIFLVLAYLYSINIHPFILPMLLFSLVMEFISAKKDLQFMLSKSKLSPGEIVLSSGFGFFINLPAYVCGGLLFMS